MIPVSVHPAQVLADIVRPMSATDSTASFARWSLHGMAALPLAALCLAVLAGCSPGGLAIGSSDYSCPAPQGGMCRSVSELHGMAPAQERDDPLSAIPILPSAGASSATVPLAAHRTPPRVLDVWLAPYVDADGDWIGEQRIRMVVDVGQWAARPDADDTPTGRGGHDSSGSPAGCETAAGEEPTPESDTSDEERSSPDRQSAHNPTGVDDPAAGDQACRRSLRGASGPFKGALNGDRHSSPPPTRPVPPSEEGR